MSQRKSGQSSLMNALGFNPDDLNANRKDALSKRQASKLRRRAGYWLDLYALAIVGGLAADAFVIAVGIQTGEPWLDVGGKVAVITAIALIVLGVSWLMRGSELVAVEKQEVAVLEGYAEHSNFTYRGSVSYEIAVEGITFQVSKTVHDAFQDDVVYRLYYSPVTKTILSAERFSERQEKAKRKPKRAYDQDDALAGYEGDEQSQEV